VIPVSSDLELLQQWRGGDQRAGKDLCGRYFDEIYRFFEHKIPDEADDLTQQTFLACIKSRDAFRGQSTFRTYLFAIARNELFMRLRREPRHQVDLEVSSLNELVSSPSKELHAREEIAFLQAALRQLPVEQQVLLEFRYWHDLGAEALAEMLETSPGAIRVRLQRARAALRKRLVDTPLDARSLDRMSRALLEDENSNNPP